MNERRADRFIDFVLFAGFSIALLLDLSGLPMRQWLGLSVALIAGYHLLVRWDWAETLTIRFARRIAVEMRVFFLVDAGLMVGIFVIVLTGLLISPLLDLPLAHYAMWLNVNMAAALLTLLLVVLKMGLHWRGVFGTAYRRVLTAPVHIERCELLSLDRRSDRNPA